MGVTGSGKTFTMANVIQAVQRPDAGHVAQQDAGRPALLRVQGVLSAQRRPLLRQLLRLLPARGLHPAARHLHREGRLDQPADRAAAAGRHQRAGEPPRRDHRRQRLVHLRPGLARGLSGDDGRPGRGPDRSTATRCSPSWSISNTSGTTSSFSRASSACGAIASRSGRPTRRWPSASSSGATRSSSSRSSIPPAARCSSGPSGCSSIPRSISSCPRSASTAAVDEIKQELKERLAGVQGPGQAAGGPAPQRPHALRHRDAPGGGLLSGHRELQPAAVRAGRPARRPTRSSASSPTTFCCSSTSRTSRCRRSAACTSATTTAR